ncbi:indole-3-glycerol phosphate synthase TrpC [Deinococcus roseus]|uniref:indole-3-glycerol-phosphate synthase n=1 Tax=Deinococcus roseus TaxID=392414 RepID=A0ABQ2CTY1_9DEIO|nr:indole-3-glycerol phosphate synthase TrpC [Deinococcus roseus]GGJ20190.1 indole-3-glycerol phosphate synthase [Deinococcus roseus]
MRLPDLTRVPGVLGEICTLRAQDYQLPITTDFPQQEKSCRFETALRSQPLALIAEVKQASPSLGAIAELDPVDAALSYQRGGASAISVLTEERYFKGSPDFLKAVVAKVEIPVLRKDFVLHPRMIEEAREWGASAVLLMVSVLGDLIGEYLEYTHHCGLDALVEVHTAEELDIALAAGCKIIGVNNRDLTTLKIDLEVSPRLIAKARAAGFEGVLIAESGYSTPEQLAEIRGIADAVLVGSSLSGSGSLEEATRELLKV